jgi:hypothetical protein
MKYRNFKQIILLVLFVTSCSPTGDFKVTDFDKQVRQIKMDVLSDSTSTSLSDSIAAIQKIVRQEIESLDQHDGFDLVQSIFSRNFLKEHYKNSTVPIRLAKNLNFIDSMFQLQCPTYRAERYAFSPQLSYETSKGISFEKEFFYESTLDIDMHQKFLSILFLNVQSAQIECIENLRKNQTK